jgi:hypothetical protein
VGLHAWDKASDDGRFLRHHPIVVYRESMENQATPVGGDPDGRSSGVITPGMRVTMKLRTQIWLIASVASIVLGWAGGYYALASSDADMANRARVLDAKIEANTKRLEGVPTKEDLNRLRMQVRMDMLSSRWECTKVKGGLACSPRMMRGYSAREWDE